MERVPEPELMEEKEQVISYDEADFSEGEVNLINQINHYLLRKNISLCEKDLIVDLGCGPGNISEKLAIKWPNTEVVGIDGSKEMILRAEYNKSISNNQKKTSPSFSETIDIIYKDKELWVSYTEDRGDWKTSTSIAKAKLDKNKLNFKNIFQAEPPIDSGYHFGSRLAIKDEYLFASAGERGQGMIAQDPTKHPGCLLYTSPSPRDVEEARMPSSA